MRNQRASRRARSGKAIPRRVAGKVLCEPCLVGGRRNKAHREVAGTAMCRWCAFGLAASGAHGMSAGQIYRRARRLR